MHNRILSAALVVLLINLACKAQTGAVTAKEDKEADKIYSIVFRLGIDGSRPVKVTLRDGTKLIGYIREINDDDFVLVAEETRTGNRLTYKQVRQLKPYESKGRKVGNAVGYVLFFGIIVANFVVNMRNE